MSSNRIKQLYEKEGQSAWQDDISRDMLNEGTILTAIEETGVRGLTSNPTIFEKAIAGTDRYADALEEAARKGMSPRDTFFELGFRDIRDGADMLRKV
ncbi:MAG TPA: transaldolase family protein, partial [Thermomicrobiales bacterium]|nr:transaldolase family protein [Thermomicrobiales bacterium]